jgi:non-ribosomal peptide synthetase component F
LRSSARGKLELQVEMMMSQSLRPIVEKPAESDLVIFDRQIIEEKNYWVEKLAAEPEGTTLRPDFLRPKTFSGQTATFDVILPAETCERLLTVSGGGPFLLYVILMASLKVSLHKHTGSSRIIIASPVRRYDEDPSQQPNALATVDDVNSESTFKQLLMSVRQTLLDAYARQRYPFRSLLKDLGRESGTSEAPLFGVGLALKELHREWPSLELDLRLEFERRSDGLAGQVIYQTELYRRETVERFIRHYLNLLRAALQSPAKLIGELALLDEAECHQIATEWNDTQASYPQRCVHELVAEQAQQRPESIAVVYGDEHLTYRELDRRSNQLARFLQSLGIGPGFHVGIWLQRSVDLIISQLAVLKAGAAFVPLDPTLPRERLNEVLEDAQALALLTQESLLNCLPAYWGNLITLDTERAQIEVQSDAPVRAENTLRNAAYVIYTSGSTGRPKGVTVEHSGLINLVQWHQQAFSVEAQDRATQVAGLSFDAAVWEVWPYLASGASLHLVDEVSRAMPQRLLTWLVEREITKCFLPTPLLEMMACKSWPPGPSS